MGAATAEDQAIGEINTTPLIDVMLVLLIMFIITIPMQTHSLPLDLPTRSDIIIDRERNKIAVEQSGTVFWNGQPVSLSALQATLDRVAALPEQPEVQLEPHADARYEVVGDVIAIIKRANVTTMGLVGNERYAAF